MKAGAATRAAPFLDDVYMHKRIHSSLGYLTPAGFEEQWREEHVLALKSELKTAQEVSNFWVSVHSMADNRRPNGARANPPDSSISTRP